MTQPHSPAARPSVDRRVMAAAALVLLVAIVATLASRREELDAVRRLSAAILAGAFILQFVSQLFFNEAMRLPLRDHVAHLGFWEFYVVRTGGSLMPAAGGVAVRLAYLRQRGLGYVAFASATLLSNVLAVVAGSVVALAATSAFWVLVGPPTAAALVLAGAVLAIGLGTLWLLHALPRAGAGGLGNRWPWLASMAALATSGRLQARIFMLSFGRHALNLATFGLLYRSLSTDPNGFLAGGLVYALSSPMRAVPITPGNLGVIEWVVALVGRSLAFDVTTGLLVALVFRAVALLAQGVGVVVGSMWLAGGRP